MIAMNILFYVPLALLCAGVFSATRRRDARRAALTAANGLFLAALFFYSPAHLGALAAVLLFNFLGLRLMAARPRARAWLAALLALADTLLLAGMKFAAVRAPAVALVPALAEVGTFVVLGASFTYLRLLHLVFEALDGAAPPGPTGFFDYVGFYPAYLSGPIDRYERFAGELDRARPATPQGLYAATARVINGFFKRLVVARYLRRLTILSFSDAAVTQLAAWKILLALYLYGAYVYLEFSGYTDVAIGTAAYMGVTLPENFDRPYLARSVRDFWSRWHITFVSWLRDYLYYPTQRAWLACGVSTPSTAALLSLLSTFVLAGVWHGEGWSFALYGLYHGLGLAAYLAYRQTLHAVLPAPLLARYDDSRVVRVLAWFATLNFVSLSWILFLDRSAIAWELLRRLL